MNDGRSALSLQHNISVEPFLKNYRLLIERVDGWLINLDNALKPHMQCQPGCSGCCKNFTVAPVEAYCITVHLKANMVKVDTINLNILENDEKDENVESCIFLDQGLCTIYPVRPLICRTHGYPIVVRSDGEVRVDHCPKNFQNIALKREYLIDIDHLNTMLFSINALFVKELEAEKEAVSHGMNSNGQRVSFHEIMMAL